MSQKPRRPYPSQKREARRARHDLAVQLYREGLSLRQIATRMNVSWQAIHAILQRAGVPRRPRGGNQGAHSRHRGGTR